jgi:glycosyltransferase involved in cell wall biosynthesis
MTHSVQSYLEPADQSTPSVTPLRLAVFGWVQDTGGSIASANYQLCRALLAAGHALDFYADSSFLPDPGYPSDAFGYVPVDVTLRCEIDPSMFPVSLRVVADRLRGRRRTRAFRRLGIAAARSRHAGRPYDALLFLGTQPGSAIAGVPTVAWPQCAPQTELAATRSIRAAVTSISGPLNYAKLRLYYEIKDRLVWRWTRGCSLILASELSRARALSFGVPPERICISPYPVDLERFTPAGIPDGRVLRVLCIGRLDPRKRVDLLVDAVEILSSRRSDFHVEVIGRDGFLPGWADYVRRAGARLPISYTEAVPQEAIAQRLRTADLVVQPSEHEEFGNAVAEALASGVPVVTGVTNGTTQYAPPDGAEIFDRYEPASLADAIDRCFRKSRDPAARAACRRAAEAFSADEVAATVAHFISTAARPRTG